jgi:hypothetical protein
MPDTLTLPRFDTLDFATATIADTSVNALESTGIATMDPVATYPVLGEAVAPVQELVENQAGVAAEAEPEAVAALGSLPVALYCYRPGGCVTRLLCSIARTCAARPK